MHRYAIVVGMVIVALGAGCGGHATGTKPAGTTGNAVDQRHVGAAQGTNSPGPGATSSGTNNNAAFGSGTDSTGQSSVPLPQDAQRRGGTSPDAAAPAAAGTSSGSSSEAPAGR